MPSRVALARTQPRINSWTLLCWLLVCLAVPLPAGAQTSTEGSIRGVIRDQQGAVLAGVTVTATSPTALGLHTVTSDSTGLYRLVNLPPGEYTIAATMDGFAPFSREHVLMRAGLNVGVDIALQLGGVSDAVRVIAETPLLETKSATAATNITGELQRSIPLSRRRDWSDFLFVTPGIISSDAVDLTFFSLHGAYLNSNVLQIDGADMASSTNNSPSYVRLSTEAIDDVQIKTAAIDASSPLGLGGVVNLATRSGTNRLSGAVGFGFQAKKWNDSNTPGGTSTTSSLFQPDLALGGPVQIDRWWFFGTYRRMNRTIGLSRTAAQLAALQALSPGFVPFDNDTKANTSFGKVTGQLSPRHQVMVSAQRDVTPSDLNDGTYAGKYQRSEQGGSAYVARLSSTWASNLTTRLGVSYNDKAIPYYVAFDDRPARNIYRSTVTGTGTLSGTGLLSVLDNYPGNGVNETARKVTLSGDATYFKDEWLGLHEFQVGVYLQPWLRQRSAISWANNGFAIEDDVVKDPANLSAGVVPFHRRIYDSTYVPATFVDGSDNAFYLQDAWQPTKRLTVNAGVRVDFVRQKDAVFNVQTQRSTNIGPRFGVNYQLTSDGHNALRASWTRVHETPSRTATGAGSTTGGYRDLYDLNLDGTFETVFVTPGSTALNPAKIFDLSHWHLPYADEITVGYRRQLPGQVTVDASVIRREFRDRAAGVEVNGIYNGNVFGGYQNQALNDIYLVANNTWNWPVYSGLEFQVSKQTAHLQLIGGYTRQWRHLAGTWQPHDPASFIQPDAFPNDKGISYSTGFPGSSLDANGLSGSQGAGVEGWRDHTLHVGASYVAPWRVVIATTFILQSGMWSGPVVTRLAAGDPAFGPTTVTLANGRVVQNPLATPIRFADATRSDGQFATPTMQIWNLRVGRTVPLGNLRLEPAVDIFNTTNHDADQNFQSGANQQYNPLYKTTRTRQLPRSAQISVRLIF